jgi:hypothetical protein
MIPVLIVELDTHDNEYHPAGAASLGKDIVDMGPAGNGLAGSYRLETLDGFACIHADAEPGKVLGQHSPAGKTGDIGRGGLKVGVLRIKESLGGFTAKSGIFSGYGRVDEEFIFVEIQV